MVDHADHNSRERRARAAAGRNIRRAWLGVMFECCGVYSRVYRNAAGTAYIGRCPRCYRALSIRIGPGGTRARFFRAS